MRGDLSRAVRREPPPSAADQIRRIQTRSAIALRVLVGLWILICLFVLLAMGTHWKL